MWLCSICSFKGGCDGGVVVCSVLFFNIWCKGVGVGVVGDLEGLSIESLSDSSPSLFVTLVMFQVFVAFDRVFSNL